MKKKTSFFQSASESNELLEGLETFERMHGKSKHSRTSSNSFKHNKNNSNNNSIGRVEFIGILHVKLVSAKDLVAKDLNGLSDPYFTFSSTNPQLLSTNEFYPGQVVKSSIQKKTLNPKYNETHNVCISNVTEDVLYIECMDWDRLSSHDFMGSHVLKLGDYPRLEEATEENPISITVPLQNVKKGEVSLQLFFTKLK